MLTLTLMMEAPRSRDVRYFCTYRVRALRNQRGREGPIGTEVLGGEGGRGGPISTGHGAERTVYTVYWRRPCISVKKNPYVTSMHSSISSCSAADSEGKSSRIWFD